MRALLALPAPALLTPFPGGQLTWAGGGRCSQCLLGHLAPLVR